ncbi:early activation antigen CD69-like isoform X2 [Polypterus senegalus]|uniref:early activation antigen CD69-like isoform X2 n=1 Tax=Polypterus senegalus TaxID=55291 RepID=UPI001965745B|nr:early activation antigen CD69-like isoform X2 [Polypterus senegalus]
MLRGDTERGKQEDTENSCCLKTWTAIVLVLFGGLLAAYRAVEYRWILQVGPNISQNITEALEYQGKRIEEIPWRKFNDHLYYFEKNNKMKWEAAAEFCHKHNATSTVFREQTEWEGIKEFISNHSVGSTWIGLTRKHRKEWHWVHEAKINIVRYPPRFLQDNDGNNCANMMNKQLFAAPCKSHHFFICEKYLSASDSVV